MNELLRSGTIVASTGDISRRTVLVGLGFGGVAAALAAAGWTVEAFAQEATPLAEEQPREELNAMMVVFPQPTDVAAFEDYYLNTHRPLAFTIPGIQEFIVHSSMVTPEGNQSEYHRIATLQFASEADLMAALGSPEGQEAIADIPAFATGGFTALLAHVELLTGFRDSATPGA